MTIQEFCDKHSACIEGCQWALDNCSSMEEVWQKCPKINWQIWMATRPGVFDDKTLRLFAVWCCRQIQHLVKDPRSVAAINAAEQFANGQIGKEELKAAYADAAAYAYANAAYADAATAAYAAAADAYTATAAYAAAADAYTATAAYAAAADAYTATAAYAAAARNAQLAYLKTLTPNFQ